MIEARAFAGASGHASISTRRKCDRPSTPETFSDDDDEAEVERVAKANEANEGGKAAEASVAPVSTQVVVEAIKAPGAIRVSDAPTTPKLIEEIKATKEKTLVATEAKPEASIAAVQIPQSCARLPSSGPHQAAPLTARPRRLPELLLPPSAAAAEDDLDGAVLAADMAAAPSLEALCSIQTASDGEVEMHHAQLADGPVSGNGQEATASKCPVRSPLQFQLPESPVLRAVWARGEAAYDRIRRQQMVKKAQLARRREAGGLVPISEAHATVRPGGFLGLDPHRSERATRRDRA